MSADYLVIANLFLLLFLGLADNQMIAALLPAFVKSLHVSIQEAGLMVVVYSVGAALASFVSGALSDFWGRRRFLQGGMALFAAASGLAWQSASFKGLIAARAVTGLAAGTRGCGGLPTAGRGGGDNLPAGVGGRVAEPRPADVRFGRRPVGAAVLA